MRSKIKKRVFIKVPAFEQYKDVQCRLLKVGDLETLLYLRMLIETGICPTDALKLKYEDILPQRRVFLMQEKTGTPYTGYQGELPRFSCLTQQIIDILKRQQEKPFTHSKLYYLEKIRIIGKVSDFSFVELRHQYMSHGYRYQHLKSFRMRDLDPVSILEVLRNPFLRKYW